MTQQQTQTTGRQLAPIDEIRGALTSEAMTGQFKMALPAHISVEKFQRVAITAISQNADVLKGDKRTLFAACMKAAQDGLLPDGREAALTTFGSTVTYMPMVAGILKKVRNSGAVSTIHSAVVYERDRFRYWVDSEGQHLEHEPVLFGERGKALGAYAMAMTKDGDLYIEPLSMADIEKIRSVSRAKDNGPWKTWWEEMAKKSAIRRLSKKLPMSTDRDDELRRVIERDDELYDLNGPQEPAAAGDAPAPKAEAEQPPAGQRQRRRPSRLDAVAGAPAPQGGPVIDGTATEGPQPGGENPPAAGDQQQDDVI